jgi:hypothetical protein
MANSIQDFKSALVGGGARPNLFEVSIPAPPDDITLTTNFPILCKAASLPASNIGSIDVPFRGRTFKVAGDRTFDVWTVTIINDEGFVIREAMEKWMQSIGQYGDASGYSNPSDYMCDAYVKQFKRSSSTLGKDVSTGSGLTVAATYQFFDIFPTAVSAIDLSYDSSDTIEEFTVDFQVQYWTPVTDKDKKTEGEGEEA